MYLIALKLHLKCPKMLFKSNKRFFADKWAGGY